MKGLKQLSNATRVASQAAENAGIGKESKTPPPMVSDLEVSIQCLSGQLKRWRLRPATGC